MSMRSTLGSLLLTFSWQELRHHFWRNAAAVVAVMLGVALAFSVHLINASALGEFSQALRSAGGEPDLQLRSGAVGGLLDENLLARLRQHPEVAVATPVLEISTYAQSPARPDAPRVLLRLIGVDALEIARLAPDLMPRPDTEAGAGADRLDLFAPDAVFLNAAATAATGAASGQALWLQQGLQQKTVRVAGQVLAAGSPAAVMDVAALQDLLGQSGQITRVDIRLRPGADPEAVAQSLRQQPGWPASARLGNAGESVQRMQNLSQAYRVNLTVLALMALFTGAFLVFSVLSLSVHRRARQFALLGVLGLTGTQRLRLILLEASVLGSAGSLLGLALGSALAAAALRLLGGDLGGGYFSASAPPLQWSALGAAGYAVLGLAAALAGAWWPARMAAGLPPAQALKGLGSTGQSGQHGRYAGALLVAAALLCLMPAVHEVALGAYVGIACLLLGGIAGLPWLVGPCLGLLARHTTQAPLSMLALERARRVRETAAVAVSGVVASLSLAVALTVMVASFRDSVTQWLDTMLPASVYVRTSDSASAGEAAFFEPAFVAAARSLPGVRDMVAQRRTAITLDPARPPVTLIARPLPDPARVQEVLPLLAPARAVPDGAIAIYVSEAMVDLYGARPGSDFAPLQAAFDDAATRPANSSVPAGDIPHFYVAGVWRDYARQFGTIALDAAAFGRLRSDPRVNDLAFWLAPGAEPAALEQALRALATQQSGSAGAAAALEFGSAAEIRATTLRIFDRSFAVTYWLQAVAIGIGLFGVAASFSAQVLARRKEFGLLVHLGLTRRQVLQVVALEGAAWTSLGALAGLALGLAVAVVLVRVVNPQSFHWSMDLSLPWLRLLALAASVVLAGTVTAWLAARAAASQAAVLAVKEDW
jgi:putative ABC transport system permease protein